MNWIDFTVGVVVGALLGLGLSALVFGQSVFCS